MGIKEVNLTGVNVGDFGHHSGESLWDLLQQIDQLQLIERVRISSIEPNLLTSDIIQLVAQSNILMPHFHIPLQSGCDRILALMKRRYNTSFFAHKVSLIKQLMPHACIAVDVITGFPGETDADFNETYRFIESLPISYLHVFTYSKRPNTPAAELKDQVHETKKRERTNALLALSDTKKETFYRQHYNTKRTVLVEEGNHNNQLFGFTDNYIKVQLPFNKDLPNSLTEIILTPDNCVNDNKE